MARTDRGVYYPTEEEFGDEDADVIYHMEQMAESIDDAIDNAVGDINSDISDIEAEQTTQNTNITKNKNNIEELQTADIRYTEPYNIEDINVDLLSMGASDFYDLWDALQEEYPNKITSQTWGVDDFGNDLKYYIIEANSKKDCGVDSNSEYYTEKLYNRLHSKPYMFFTSGVHGDEKLSVYYLYIAIKDYLEGKKDSDKFLMDNFNYVILPCVNPSGLNSNTRNNGNNVNINRNFPTSNWADQQETDKGTIAGDQKETQFVVDVLGQFSDKKYKVGMPCIDWHSQNYYEHADKRVLWFTINRLDFKDYMLDVSEELKEMILEDYPELATNPSNNEHFINFVSGGEQANANYYFYQQGYVSATGEVPDQFTQGVQYTEKAHRIAYMVIANTILKVSKFSGNQPEQIYNHLADIGCTVDNTLTEVINALPNNSRLEVVLSTSSNLLNYMPEIDGSHVHGSLTIKKSPTEDSKVTYLTYRTYGFITPRIWIASYNNNDNFYGWKLLADNADIETELEAKQNEIDELQEDNENLRNAMPGVVGTGSNIVLERTSKNKFKKFEISGNIEQYSTKGDNILPFVERDVTSHNINYICDEKGNVNINGIGTQYTAFPYNYDNPIKLYRGNYKLKIIGSFDKTRLSIFFNEEYSSPLNIDANNEVLININTDEKEIIIKFMCEPQLQINSRFYITLAEGSTATEEYYTGGIASPSPEFKQDIKNVVGNIVNKVSNKNLFDKNDTTAQRYIEASTGLMKGLQGASASGYINIKDIENLIMSGDTQMRTNGGAFYNSNKEYISGFTTQQIYDGINVPSGSYYVRVTTTTGLLDVIQLEPRNNINPLCHTRRTNSRIYTKFNNIQ